MANMRKQPKNEARNRDLINKVAFAESQIM